MKKVQQYGPFYSKMEKYGHFYVKLGKCGPFLIKTIDIWTILLTNAKYFGPFYRAQKQNKDPFNHNRGTYGPSYAFKEGKGGPFYCKKGLIW